MSDGVPDKYAPKDPYWYDEPYLRTLYEDRGLALEDIADRVPVSRPTLREAMADLGIEIRPAPHVEPDAYKGLYGGGFEFTGLTQSTEEIDVDWTDL